MCYIFNYSTKPLKIKDLIRNLQEGKFKSSIHNEFDSRIVTHKVIYVLM